MALELIHEISQLLEKVRATKPLVHHITNYVTVNDCANIVLAIGASPIMADDIDEVESITAISQAIVLNIGTLNKRTVESMIAAGKKANQLGIPVAFDPVGAGASRLRNETTEKILQEISIDVLRGNMSEIRFVAGLKAETKGVEASEDDQKIAVKEGRFVAEKVALALNCVAAVTGATDIISDGKRVCYIRNGTEHMSNVTGTGCMCSSLVGAFLGAAKPGQAFMAATAGVLVSGLSGELAHERAGHLGYGSFHRAIIDVASKIDATILRERAIIDEV